MRSIRERILKVTGSVGMFAVGFGCSEVDPGEDTESSRRTAVPSASEPVAVRSIRERILKVRRSVWI